MKNSNNGFIKFMVIYNLAALISAIWDLIRRKYLDKITGRLEKSERRVIGTIDGVDVVYNPDMVSPFVFACIRSIGTEYVIYVDKLFTKLSKDTQRFILLHELGHLNHIEKKSIYRVFLDKLAMEFPYSKNNSYVLLEHKCDLNAVDELGFENCVAALKEMRSYKLQSFNFNISMTLRIRMMEQAMKAMWAIEAANE